MELRYKALYGSGYDINCHSFIFYRYWENRWPIGIYKYKFFGLRFWGPKNLIKGIKIDYGIKGDYW